MALLDPRRGYMLIFSLLPDAGHVKLYHDTALFLIVYRQPCPPVTRSMLLHTGNKYSRTYPLSAYDIANIFMFVSSLGGVSTLTGYRTLACKF